MNCPNCGTMNLKESDLLTCDPEFDCEEKHCKDCTHTHEYCRNCSGDLNGEEPEYCEETGEEFCIQCVCECGGCAAC